VNRGLYRILVEKEKETTWLRWEDDIEMDLQLVRYGDMDWIALAQDGDRWLALVNGVLNLRVP